MALAGFRSTIFVVAWDGCRLLTAPSSAIGLVSANDAQTAEGQISFVTSETYFDDVTSTRLFAE